MALPLLAEIGQFITGEVQTPNAARLSLMLAALSPAARRAALFSNGIQLGCFNFRRTGACLQVRITGEAAVPPVEWWPITGDVSVEAERAPQTARSFIQCSGSSWRRSTVTSLELTCDDEVLDDARRQVLQTLGGLQNTLTHLLLTRFTICADEVLPHFTRLRTLLLDGCGSCVNRWTGALGSMTERLEITDCHALTDDSLAKMPETRLHRLVLDGTNASSTCVEALPRAASLRTLSLIDCRNIDALSVGDFGELRLLLLGRTPLTSDLLKGIEKCRHLTLINLGGCRGITDLNVLGELKELRELFAHETSVTNTGILALANCDSLEKLNLGGCTRVSDVNHLGALQGLSELHLWSTKVTNAGIRQLSSCRSLTELVLDDCIKITDVTPLQHLQALRWLSLIGTSVNGNGVKELAYCAKLETLALGGTRIEQPPKLWRHDAIVQYLSSL